MKISPYRTGEPRYGKADYKEPVNGDVIEWTMTPEQLEEYRNRPKREQIKMKQPIIMPTKKKEERQVELTRELYTDLKAKGKTDKQIIDEYGLHSNLMQKLKNKWGLAKKSRADYQKEVAQPHLADSQKEIEKLEKRINELETALAEKIKAYAELESACSDIESELIETQKNTDKLQKELGQKQAHIDELAKTITQQEEQILTLQIDSEEYFLGFEKMKGELAIYKERYEKTADLLKTFI